MFIIYMWYMRTHFSSVGPELHYVGGVKCQPFLKHSNHWKPTLKCFMREPCALVTVLHSVFLLWCYYCSESKPLVYLYVVHCKFWLNLEVEVVVRMGK